MRFGPCLNFPDGDAATSTAPTAVAMRYRTVGRVGATGAVRADRGRAHRDVYPASVVRGRVGTNCPLDEPDEKDAGGAGGGRVGGGGRAAARRERFCSPTASSAVRSTPRSAANTASRIAFSRFLRFASDRRSRDRKERTAFLPLRRRRDAGRKNFCELAWTRSSRLAQSAL